LVEVIVVSTLILLIFGGLFAGVKLMVVLVGQAKGAAGARALAAERLEYIRSLPYASVGTVNGIPEGTLPQTSTTTMNGITYTEHLVVTYLDRPEDGFGAADDNGVPEDSKSVAVTYTWSIRGRDESLSLATDIIPEGIESTTGGGTLFINVFDANVAPVSGAQVHVYNDTGTSTIDVTVSTNANGIANVPGAPARSGYQISATKSGYSTDQTYSATAENSSPNPPPVSVIAGAVSTVNFAIDRLASLTLHAVTPPVGETFDDTFDDLTGTSDAVNVAVEGGALVLSGGAGTYAANGSVRSVAVTPDPIQSWGTFTFTLATTTNTSATAHVVSVTGTGTSTTYTLVPDEVLPGNSAGFTNGSVDLSEVDVATYPSLAMTADLTSTDPAETPSLSEWHLSYIEDQAPVDGLTVALAGAKTIGTTDGVPVLKYEGTATTNGDGEAALASLEWDVYTFSIDGAAEGYDIAEVDGPMPYTLDPGADDTLTFVVVPHTDNSLRVTVTNAAGTFVPNASVTVSRTGWSDTDTTGAYGQVFFADLTAGTYTLSVTASGYETFTQSTVTVDGQGAVTAALVAG
jgi:hypothetical protein